MKKRSITVAGHRTSVSVEEPFWQALAAIAAAKGTSIATTIAAIDRDRPADVSLSAAIRTFTLDWYRTRAR